ncbi:MAG: RNA polymerase sigma factor [Pseudomonadota bacterium]|nr:RNA polymerase sigma factor [Pseudomonadota bacterium]
MPTDQVPKPQPGPPCDPDPPGEDADGATRAELVTRLFREHNQALISLLTLQLRSVQDAKEVAQESYVRLLQLDRPGAASLLRAYLFRIASNLAVDRLRQRNVRYRSAAAVEAELFEEVTVRDDPERRTLAAEELEFVNGCLQELSPACQHAFYLHRVQGLAVTDIATELGVTERMVRHHLTRALTYCQLRLRGASKEEAQERLKR